MEHTPRQPRSDEPVLIAVTVEGAVESLTLEYQVVEPGAYLGLRDREYRSRWTEAPMEHFHAENRFVAKLPGSIQKHRRLVRYRLKGARESGEKWQAPAADSPEPNYAYFVYDGVPSWKAAIQPKARGENGKVVEYPPAAMGQVQSYFLIAKHQDVGNATWYRRAMDKEYRYSGTLVANGRVYDHIGFRARGGEWRYAMGKNMWKFDFHKSNRLQAQDDYGQPYKASWSKLNLRACIQQGDYGRRGEQGMYEAVGFRLFNLAGVESPRTHWLSLRIVDGPEENTGDQYAGDFWGLYLAIENEDGRFLEEHGLPNGNIYKMKFWQGELENHGDGQPTDGSDLAEFLPRLQMRQPDPQWWKERVDLDRYFSYRSILEAIHHYDLDAGKNYTFYLNPNTRKWQVIPWDIDLSWADHMFGGGGEPFKFTVLSEAAWLLKYQNRQREIRDLLFNPEETGRLIDECAAIIWRPGAPSIVDADRAKWDYHPIMTSRYVNSSKAGHGLFYNAVPGGDFAGMVRQMKDYVKRRGAWIDRVLLNDRAIPETPAVTYAGPAGFPADALSFESSEFSGQTRFGALQWRIAEVDLNPDFSQRPARPGHYEITALWQSSESTEFNRRITIPANVVRPGHAYRVRLRFKDTMGRWSHWSSPVEFTVQPRG